MNARNINLTAKACLRYLKHRKIPKAKGHTCIIAGNGPSLKDYLERHLPILQRESVFCVNHFLDSPAFPDVKPTYYMMLDPNLSRDNLVPREKERRNITFKTLNEKTTWDMHLFFPCYPGQMVIEDYLQSPHLHLHICNIFPGFTWPWIRNHVYKTGLFMPPPQNVLVAAIYEAINMGYKEIYLLGAEHSWTEDLRVREDNVLCMVHKHFSGCSDEVPFYKATSSRTETFKVHEIFGAFRRIFRSYWLLQEYAEFRGVKIYNSTPSSYIDAFERKDISELA